jgi:hypothetical protein
MTYFAMTPTTETSLRFAGDWQFLPVLAVATGLAALMFWLYRRELRFHSSPWAQLPAILRSLAVFLLVIALAGPVLRHETSTRQLGRVIIALDASQSMKLVDEIAGESKPEGKQKPSRWQSATSAIFNPETALLKQLSAMADVELTALRGPAIQRLWWHRQGGSDVSGLIPTRLDLIPDAQSTDLDKGLREALGPLAPGTALVLLSDGQHNAEGSPEELANTLKGRGVPVFAVGYGAEISPPDISLVDVTAEQVQGTITLRDSMPAGLPAIVRIESQGKVLFEEPFTTDGKGERRMPYSFLMKDMPPAPATESDPNLRIFNVLVGINGDQANAEKTRSNNTREVALHLLAKKRRLLILDGRARWETRYIQTHFERDERWQVTAAFDDYKASADNALAKGFPGTKDELLTYDLILIGEVSPKRLKLEHVAWLVEFVEKRGGGLVWLDGERGLLKDWATSPAAALLPVQWTAPGHKGPMTWTLTPESDRYPALRLSGSASANTDQWAKLPKALWTATTKANATAVTLANLVTETKVNLPAIVFQSVGAGAVLYLASDELWRWRFEVADLYHQRLWVQVAAWVAAPPFQAESQLMALGTDRLRFATGEQGELRVRLRNTAGEMVTDAHPRAYLIQNGQDVATLELEADPTHAGVYRATTPPMKPGAWQVAVSESSTSVRDKLRLTLRVADTGNQELSSLTMNRPLLETMARTSGGKFLREQEIPELPKLLQAMDNKQVQTRETILWSSWWWLGTLIALLSAEWILRRKWRLV